MKKTEEILAYRDRDGQEIKIPAVTFTGDSAGPHAVITAGVHGCEYPPIIAAAEFCRTCKLEDVRGTITVVTISALNSFEKRTPFVCPVDGKNPNRFFPGDESGSYTECLTYHLFHDIISKGDYHIDLHCGDMTETLAPFCEFGTGFSVEVDQKSREIALYSGMPNLVESNFRDGGGDLPEGLGYMNSVRYGIPAAIVEVGQMGRTDRDYVEGHLFCIRNVLRRFGNLSGQAVPTATPSWFTTYDSVYAPATGIFLRCVEAGEDVVSGQKIGVIEDYFGNPIAEATAHSAGRILYLTSSIAVQKDGFLLDMVLKS
ncbi:N-alpha-acetyl-L-2,4-diaminobutyric acid deacetylase [bioreactor metagenome]|uniref:N-alpha-acetyl-L-2,4-diaminobutyric acid deacetylase n=1 Tax=bioreactor metagenome TaxID=1076179 RepID=A0A644Y128_9ZZZZ